MAIHDLQIKPAITKPSRLDLILAEEIPAVLKKIDPKALSSKSKIRRLILAGAVSLNNRQERRPALLVFPGTKINVTLNIEKFLFEKTPDDVSFELTQENILFEDESILLVNKPARFPTEATIVVTRDNLHSAVKRYLNSKGTFRNQPYSGLLHRLDRDTSGVILFSKTRTVNASIHDSFLRKIVQKEYLAITTLPTNQKHPESNFSVKDHIARISPKGAPGKWGAVSNGGDEAHTDFALVEAGKTLLLIRAFPRTGRTHQIRVHLSGIGFPIIGDPLYGGKTDLSGKPVLRAMLHAASITIPHPVTGKPLTVSAPLPKDFTALASSAGLSIS